MRLENIVRFKEIVLCLKPKRSPIFWGLITLVLTFTTPSMLVMLRVFAQLVLAIPEIFITGESLPLGDKDFRELMLLALFIGLVGLLLSFSVFTAMICLIFKKYRSASRLLIAGPVCYIALILITLVTYLREDMPREELFTGTFVMFTAQTFLIFVILFLYARKYLMMENTPMTA